MNGLLRSTTRSLLPRSTQATQAVTEFRGLQGSNLTSQKQSRTMRRAASSASSSIAELERATFQQINQHRRQNGLAALQRNSVINQQARQHSQAMANSRKLSHDGFSSRVRVIGNRIAYKSAAENVAFNQGFSNPVAQAVNGWLRSPGHLKNIVGNYNLTGIGVAKNNQGEFYFTQIFIRQ
ncbi:CAP domain-containing protein [Egbenema bharatensis]|uniref:CAP domain-containing protein n=1 Tax=Egbenema bharatensis TaxID=3463334 RepID=UPI003A89CBC7